MPVDAEAQATGRIIPTEKGNESDSSQTLSTDTAVFHWENLSYDINIKKQERRILDQVDGWVKPGASTALMVSSLLF